MTSSNSSALTQIDMIVRVEYHGEPVLLTKQLAQALSAPGQPVSESQLRVNFKNNRDRYVEGKHYFKLEGAELTEFKKHAKNLNDVLKGTARLILWTKRGVARHCKSVGTDIAWHIFELLEDNYFDCNKNFCLPKPAACDREGAKILARLAAAACAPEIKDKLAMKAANLLLGEEFFPAARLAGAKVSASVPLS